MSDIERVVEWLASLGGHTSNEDARAIQALSARAEAAEAEVVRLTEELSKSTRWGPPPELPETDTEGRALRARVATMENRVTVAEAEVERLRAALHSITLSYDERCGIDHATLARSALEAKP